MGSPIDQTKAGSTLSLCMIVKNEGKTLQRCLESVRSVVDEIVIVDTGSTDNTREVASKYTDRVFNFDWVDDFAAARNFSFSKATTDYILWLDADDVVSSLEASKLMKLRENLDSSIDAVSMRYSLTRDEYGNTIHSVRRIRMVKYSRNFQWTGAVHEDLVGDGVVFNSDITVTHEPIKHDLNRNLAIFEKQLATHEPFTPREILLFANELFDNKLFQRALEYYGKFLECQPNDGDLVLLAYGKIAECNTNLGDSEQALESLFKTFKYDLPRAEYCCMLGSLFAQQDKWNLALFWFELATVLERPPAGFQVMNEACWTWYPHQELCVCHTRMGQYQRAYDHNEIALQYRSNDRQLLERKRILLDMLR